MEIFLQIFKFLVLFPSVLLFLVSFIFQIGMFWGYVPMQSKKRIFILWVCILQVIPVVLLYIILLHILGIKY